jgi:hypothetical protein
VKISRPASEGAGREDSPIFAGRQTDEPHAHYCGLFAGGWGRPPYLYRYGATLKISP